VFPAPPVDGAADSRLSSHAVTSCAQELEAGKSKKSRSGRGHPAAKILLAATAPAIPIAFGRSRCGGKDCSAPPRNLEDPRVTLAFPTRKVVNSGQQNQARRTSPWPRA